ncbi:MAG: hypothetical protein AAF331_01110 [Pseudomonadota bacterium]
MTVFEFCKITRLAAITLLGAILYTAAPPAKAQLANCINQCDAIAYQCERNVNDEYQRCLDHRETRIQACEREGNERRNYCLRNRAPSCDLSGQFAFDGCMNFVQACEPNGRRCDDAIRTCVQRCENEAAAAKPRHRPAPRSKPAPQSQRPSQPRPVILDFVTGDLAGPQHEISIYKFEHSEQLNEFKRVDDEVLLVRNLRATGNHGKWHKYTRTSPTVFKAVTSDATYTQATKDTFVWTHGDRSITLIRQDR